MRATSSKPTSAITSRVGQASRSAPRPGPARRLRATAAINSEGPVMFAGPFCFEVRGRRTPGWYTEPSGSYEQFFGKPDAATATGGGGRTEANQGEAPPNEMTTNQLFFALAGLMVTLFGVFGVFVKYYLDAKLDPIQAQVKQIIDYMLLHQGKISALEERTKKL
jgi:hypothetical protein